MIDSLKAQRLPIATSELVLIELADAMAGQELRMKAARFVDLMRRDPGVTIEPITAALLQAGWDLYRTRPDKGWGLTDCTSFVLMKRLGLTQAATSDRHFQQAGFTTLL